MLRPLKQLCSLPLFGTSTLIHTRSLDPKTSQLDQQCLHKNHVARTKLCLRTQRGTSWGPEVNCPIITNQPDRVSHISLWQRRWMVALGAPNDSHWLASSSAGFLPGVDYLEKEIPTLASVGSIRRSLPINLRGLCLKSTFSKSCWFLFSVAWQCAGSPRPITRWDWSIKANNTIAVGQDCGHWSKTWFSRNQSKPSPWITCGIRSCQAGWQCEETQLCGQNLNLCGGLDFQEGRR